MLVKKRGYALLIVLGFAAVLAVFTASMASRTAFGTQTIHARGQVDKASYAAQSGIQATLANLYDPVPTLSSISGGDTQNLASADWFINNRTVYLDGSEVDMSSMSQVYHNIVGMPGAVDIAPDETVIPKNFFYIISVGLVGATINEETREFEGGIIREATTIGTIVGPIYPLMPQAIFANGELDLRDTYVDHFDSRTGPKVRNNGAGNGLMECDFPEATVVVNHNRLEDVHLSTARIDGHFLFNKASMSILEVFQESHDSPQAPSIVEPAWRYGVPGVYMYNGPNDTINGYLGSLTLEGLDQGIDLNALELTEVLAKTASPYTTREGLVLEEGGIYLQEGDLVVSGYGEIIVQDSNGDGEIEDTILLVEDDIRFLGSNVLINWDGLPKNLKLYSLNENTTFEVQDNQYVCALVTGKKMDIRLTNAEIWGAVMGNNVLMKNSYVNFDSSLQDPSILVSNFSCRVRGEGSELGIKVQPMELLELPINGFVPPSMGGDMAELVVVAGPLGTPLEPGGPPGGGGGGGVQAPIAPADPDPRGGGGGSMEMK